MGGPGDGPRCCKSPDCPVHGAVYGQDPELPGGLGGGSGRGEAGEYLRHFGPPTGCQHPYGDHQAKPLPGGGGYGADFSGHDGGPVRKPLGPGAGAEELALFDFSVLRQLPLNVKLDVGASSYWSEIASMQTLDNLLLHDKITLLQYLERIPQGYVARKQELTGSAAAGGGIGR